MMENQESTWQEYLVDLRASPDTPAVEAMCLRQDIVLGPQTVHYRLYANSPEEAVEKAIAYEKLSLYRKEVFAIGPAVKITKETTNV